jgi:hypothetical protein
MMVIPISVMILTSCSTGPGSDAISSQKGQAGTGISSCTTRCHNATSTISPDPLVTNGSGTYGKHVAHVSNTGIACEKCHLSYLNNAAHMNGHLDTGDPLVLIVYFDATNPTGTWINDTGPSTGQCSSLNCHGADTLDWYGTGTASFLSCSSCHSYTIGIRRQVTGAGGDFGGNASIVSHHVTTSGDPVRAQCLVCHDQSTHTAGTVRLRNADTGASIAYDPAVPSSLEPFCLSCHDADSALTTAVTGSALSPFDDGKTLGSVPHVAGNKIAGYWNGSYNVHRNTAGLTCAGTGSPGTGCHGNSGTINMHGSSSRGLLTKNLTLPVPSSTPYNYEDYRLCFDCHDNYPAVTKEVVLGYRLGGNYDVSWAPTPYYTSGIQSLFRDRYIANTANYPAYWGGINQLYNDSSWGDPYTPLHNWHLSTDGFMNTVWKYRGITVGRASCITCHNVHGTSAATVRSTYSEFGITAFSNVFPGGELDEYKKLVPDANYEDFVLKAYPINCNISCHSILPGTSYWHTPSGE